MIPILDFLSPIISKVLDYIPDPKMKAEAQLKMTEELNRNQEAILAALTGVDQKQADVNSADANSGDKFRSWWRPACAWVCVLAFTWAYVLQPIVVFSFSAFGHPIVDLPKIDVSAMMPVLLGMLGLAGMRSLDKKNGVE